jgi:hypothetical protein
MRTSNGVGSRDIGPAMVEAFDNDLKRLLNERFPEPLHVKHRVWRVVSMKPNSVFS